eukprot:662472-Amphidinium_carterae.1
MESCYDGHLRSRHATVNFGCAARCAAREPELERSLSPFADWASNSSALQMLELFNQFCTQGFEVLLSHALHCLNN